MQKQTRREFLKNLSIATFSAASFSFLQGCANLNKNTSSQKRPPNIIFVLTDDQGFGDLGCHGNKKIETPNLDKFAAESAEFSQFYVCPVCAPTRASLMTGRYNYRTRAIDTYLGRAMMDTEEVTIAEMLKTAGYKTAIFGKWHLGDNYPMRPMEQGFDESIVHRGGGIGQPADPPGGSDYFDPILFHNGKQKKYKGYCMDVYTDETLKFIKKNRNKPFFVYLPTNTVHGPLIIGKEYEAPYRAMGFDEKTAKVYGMVTNIDDNFGRLLKQLKKLNLEENTIVIFMTDNGPCGYKGRYTAGLKGHKATVYENGIRVPCLIRWPNGLKGERKIDTIAAHIDIVPTLLEACDVQKPENIKFDGISLMPLLTQTNPDWPKRTLYFQWHRGDVPELYRCFAVRNQRYKLLQAQGIGNKPEELKFELYDISKDPGEKNNLIDKHPEIAEKMKRQYEDWFKDVSSTRGFDPPNIYLGTPYENPVVLTRQDMRRKAGGDGWGDEDLGHWQVDIIKPAKYNITITLPKRFKTTGQIYFKFKNINMTKTITKGSNKVILKVKLPQGPARLEAWAEVGQKLICPRYVDVEEIK
ncbi:MAG: arylsulfatase [Planctomycetota bacterium]|jgi:arylsulfatase A-like enzyme